MTSPTSTATGRAPELDLLLACTRWPQLEPDRDRIRALFLPPPGAPDLDLDLLLRLIQHHRLTPLVAQNLRTAAAGLPLPPARQALLDHLGQLAAANAYRALRSLAEMRRILQELLAAGVPVRVLKGIPLAQMVFGDLGLRSTGDLDLLIPESAILQGDRILRAAGYRGLFQVQRFSPRRLAFYRNHWKDIAYENPVTGHQVDLHWRCFRNSRMSGGELCAASSQETGDFGAFHVPTLPRSQTLLYLCVHGTLDGWLYLKSLADIAALVRLMPEAELDALAELALHHGILPELSAALLLTRRYLAIEHWSARLLDERHPTVRHILRFARHSLEHGNFLSGRAAISAGSMMLFELGLRRDLPYRRELLLRVLFRARMWETIPLPDLLFGIYPLLSPIEWIVFRIRQWLGKTAPHAGLSV
ncbi:MAG: nucleotidyltransferase family protein [Acidobacteriota bacterium]|nr:nucleotidyltransferase family protein [Acidobacteriota bacterium]